MVRKATKAERQKFPRRAVPVFDGATEQKSAENYSALMTSPEFAALRIVDGAESNSGLGEKIDMPSLLLVLRDQAAELHKGDLKRVESILMNQATALQSLFSRLADRGMRMDTIPGFEANMKMALRAQSQCRATLETLAAIKNPPVVYARQANVTTGPQQVNNGVQAPRSRENETMQSKQSGDANELLPHTRAPRLASGDDSAMEALGEVDRAKFGHR
jgi:hypothetical protein